MNSAWCYYDDSPTYSFPGNHIRWRYVETNVYRRLQAYEHFLVRNKFSRFNFSILDLPKLRFDTADYLGEEYKNFKYSFDCIMMEVKLELDDLDLYNRLLLILKKQKKLLLTSFKLLKKNGKKNSKKIKQKI